MLREEIEKHIRKLVGTLKEEESLLAVLKARLTKREYKLLLGWANGNTEVSLSEKLKLDTKSYEELSGKLIKKLNQEKLKQEIVE